MRNVQKDQRLENSKKTVLKILTVARRMFSKQGFAKTSTTDIVKKAGIARGGLYHHFPEKKDIFKAVFTQVTDEIATKIKFDQSAFDTMHTSPDEKKEHLLRASMSLITMCLDPKRFQILMIDAPAVLGISEVRILDKELMTSQLIKYLNALKEVGLIKPVDIETTSHLLAGAANEAVFLIARSKNKEETIEKIRSSFGTLIESFWV